MLVQKPGYCVVGCGSVIPLFPRPFWEMFSGTLKYASINGLKACFPLIAFIYTLSKAILGSIKRSIYTIQDMTQNGMTQQVAHPMAKLQRQVRSLVEGKLLKPTDSIWKIALLYGDDWSHWKQELLAFEFAMQDPVSDLLAVESWEEED